MQVLSLECRNDGGPGHFQLVATMPQPGQPLEQVSLKHLQLRQSFCQVSAENDASPCLLLLNMSGHASGMVCLRLSAELGCLICRQAALR